VDAPIFAETASSFTILGADGNLTTIDATSPAVAGWSPLQFARVSLGGLGMVTRMTLDVLPRPYATTLQGGTHIIRGRAWSGAGVITQVEVSVDGGQTWHAAHLEPPRERWLWGRWSYVWDAQPGQYRVMSRATDEVGRVEPQTPRYNNMRKNFSAIVATDVTVV